MSEQTTAIGNDLDQLAKDAGILIAATAGLAEEQVGEARKRLAGMLERGKDCYGAVRHRVADATRAADRSVHDPLYQAVAIGIGAGVIIGFVLAARCSRKCVFVVRECASE
jgi:ElaB/YqjD/DUF883 family membrane-anchored ribosome-binding protein